MPARLVRGSIRIVLGAVVGVMAAAGLAGCSGNGPGQLLVDPGAYDGYRCNDLIQTWNRLNQREAELRANMNRSNQSSVGTVIGAAAYGTDFQTVLTQKKMVQQEAEEKKCEITKTYQSDQTVR